MLPMSGGNAETEPDRRERTVHLACGFPAYDPARNAFYRRTDDQSPQNPFYIQQSLVRALARAHYPKSPVRPPAPLD